MSSERTPALVTAQVHGLLASWASDWSVDVNAASGMGGSLAEQINCGDCGTFAEALVDRLYEDDGLNAFTLATDDFMHDLCKPRRHSVEGVHIWTYVPETGKHYDSEAPEGVEDWLALPFFARWSTRHKIARASSPEDEAKRLAVTALAWERCRAEIRTRVVRGGA